MAAKAKRKTKSKAKRRSAKPKRALKTRKGGAKGKVSRTSKRSSANGKGMEKKVLQLKAILADVSDLNTASSVLGWDQQTYMPPGGAESRGEVLGTLGRMAHEQFTTNKVGKLLDELKPYVKSLDPDSYEARLVKVTKRQYDKAVKVPAKMVEERSIIQAAANQAWMEARQKSDFSIFAPHLETVVDYVQRYARLFRPYDHIYDALLDDYEPGMKTADVKAIFNAIRPKQVALIEAISKKPQVDDTFLHQQFDEAAQLKTGAEIVGKFGYDFKRGRQDKVTHPFASNLGYGDQRITIRVDEKFFNSYLFAAMHESGHAMYEQGVGKDLYRTPLYGGTSLAIHESQSRMWENLVGRSRDFWTFFYPRLQQIYPSQFANVSLDSFYKGINKVEPSLIRVEADEATYNLHIMLRLEIEIALLEGTLAVKDLPGYWNAKFKEYLGITPPNDAKGVLQDVHWSFTLYGYFATYALGNLVSAQLWEKILQDNPNIPGEIRKGNFKPLLGWLQDKIYRHGSKFEPQELVQRITGSKINGEPYIRYLTKKYGDIYGL